MADQRYPHREPAVKLARDRVLLRVGPDVVECVYLTGSRTVVRDRLRRWAHRVVKRPALLRPTDLDA